MQKKATAEEQQRQQELRAWGIRERAEFEAGFTRSRTGNLSRRWDDETVTVFKRRQEHGGGFGWVVSSSAGDPTFSDRFDTEAEAMADLIFHLDIGVADVLE